ncbi:hypothetical protein [Dyadobacter frigoris]|uniref:Uncharacterized protein n=1 Tax=Dyadobacter frigoris TaxID=2576211 RepID=A0A4U6D7D7_9BACT|nr:hypothetical protein [Dyadobacter frigoris]TKT92676.1 hypothetical protein FDK13_07635 [Dyadobacter frigoris]
MLNSQSTDILRPTDVKELSVIVSDFLKGSPSVIPKSYSLEIAPYLLARANKLKLSDLNKKGNQLLSTIRFSLGTSSNKDGDARQSAFGLRFTPLNKGDARFDTKFKNDVGAILEERQNLDSRAVEIYIREGGLPPGDSVTNAIREKRIQSILDSLSSQAGLVNDKLNSLREKYKKDNWNSKKMDFAVALMLSSPDSLAKNAKVNKFSAWGTYAFPIKSWGQGLLGAVASTNKLDSLFTDLEDPVNINTKSFALSARLYFGVNRLKGFFECQGKTSTQVYTLKGVKNKEDNLSALLNLGGELNINSSMWLEFNTGLSFTDQKHSPHSKLVGGFNLRFAIPEKFNF